MSMLSYTVDFQHRTVTVRNEDGAELCISEPYLAQENLTSCTDDVRKRMGSKLMKEMESQVLSRIDALRQRLDSVQTDDKLKPGIRASIVALKDGAAQRMADKEVGRIAAFASREKARAEMDKLLKSLHVNTLG